MRKWMISLFSSSCIVVQLGHRYQENLTLPTLRKTFSTLPWFSNSKLIYPNSLIMGKKTGPSFYAVARGRNTGIFRSWSECEAQVKQFPNARFKGFKTENEAKDFIEENTGNGGSAAPSSSALKIEKPETEILTGAFGNQKSTMVKKPRVKKVSKPVGSEEFDKMQEMAYEVLKKAGYDVETPSKEGRVSSNISKGRQKRGRGAQTSVNGNGNPDVDDRVVNKRLKLNDSPGDTTSAKLEKFTVDPAGYVVVFTDGACSKNGRSGSKAGIGVWFGDQHFLNLSEPVEGRQTNNTAEIQAAEKAILQAKKSGISKLNVQTDSKFVINCITEWMKKWKKNGWKLRNGQEVINRVDLEKLDKAAAGMEIKWTYVPGHKGHLGNEAADRLAVEGANKVK